MKESIQKTSGFRRIPSLIVFLVIVISFAVGIGACGIKGKDKIVQLSGTPQPPGRMEYLIPPGSAT
jgi:hypothetical protein